MAKKTKIKQTFDFGKLAHKFPSILSEGLNVIGKNINKAIQDGIDQGKDIKGKSFTPLEPITKELGGKKILDRS